ncbi:site-specific integrase [Bariatricus massiliensis]|uniref:Site-specific integrase n=1 Tax=Bariatricus massiliensis TaxID=1745713 RepID=A0ABS8DDZ0_9FIRM|nr:site-specific integrase [Bariatricus massiliensis]MCB7302746.1 site-specific integrase [Bariatricus massiliensis]MCB7373962.1 site-specific integrase [Bariatricus massiliensis]MCB7386632.1 site-specific integrase [Bariatricus massiliensis]MCB7410794.1 site-specific integrase [Bariatricus massiliensis]MCQ5251619.1 site-specific integrase [Bariatricus massiliensis]
MARKDNKGRNLHTGESQRKIDGLYMYRYTDTRSGKRQTVYAGDLPELREKEKQIAKDMDDNILTDAAIKKMTVNTLFGRYMQTKELAETTRINYVNMWNGHAKDDIGNIKVVQLRSSHVKAFYAKMSKAEYSHSTIKLIHTLLYPALEMAVDDDIIRKNPARNALSSDYGEAAKEKDVLTFDEQQRLFNFICESNVYNVYVPMLTIMLEVGLRCGELIGLTWSDVNMEKKDLFINHQLIYKDFGDGYKFHASDTKTDAGIRTIPLSQTVQKAFTEQRKLNFMLGRHSTETVDGYSDFIFLAKTGRPLMPSAVNNILYNIVDTYNKEEVIKAKKEHRKALLLPKISAHNLRHTACTNMAKRGMNLKILQYIMGHAHSDVTMDVYNHIADMSDVREEIARYEKVVEI